MSNVAVVVWLLVGLVLVGVLSLILTPPRGITSPRSHFRLIGALAVVTIVFMKYTSAANDTDRKAIEQNAENNALVAQAMRNSEYETCVNRNEDRLYRRNAQRGELSIAQARLEAVRNSTTPTGPEIPGYSEATDPAVRAIVDAFLADTEAQRLTLIQEVEVEVERLATNLETYTTEFPLESCGEDPVPEDQIHAFPTLPPPVSPVLVTIAPTTTTTSTTTSTTLPAVLEDLLEDAPDGASPPLPSPIVTSPPATAAPTFNPSGNPNAGPGNSNGNGNGGRP